MALTGIQIFKWLPKTNCGECGVPTCLAFAMSLAAGKAELTACPYISDEAKAKLEEASAPPIRPVAIGCGKRALKVGGETVLFRHEKRFENPTGIGMLISDTMDAADVDSRLKRFAEFEYERVGLILKPELIALKSESGDAATFTALVNKVKEGSDASLILMSDQPAVIAAALESCAEQKPLIHAATTANYEEMAALALKNCCPLAARAGSLDELAQLTEKLSQLGVKEIVIDSGAGSFRQAFADQVAIRRAALLKKFRPLGFPTIVFTCELTDSPMQEALMAATFVAKYSGIVVLSDFQGESLFPLLVERMNLFTDPQRPLATSQGIYEIGGPGDDSPVLLTCNFSLTYFIVTGETENAKVPGYLLVKDTEGLSVMTAWAAGKFSADIIGPFIKKCGIADKVTHRKLIIPGYVAAESGGLEEELPDWEILVGPREAAHIPAYLKTWRPKE